MLSSSLQHTKVSHWILIGLYSSWKNMRTFNCISIMLLTCSIVGLAAWGAVASVSYNWATEHTGVKRDVLVPSDYNEAWYLAGDEKSESEWARGLYCMATLGCPSVYSIQASPTSATFEASTWRDLA
jgi:hypothetical protein